MKKNPAVRILFAAGCVLVGSFCARAQGVVIPTDTTQADFLKAYAFVLNQSNVDYRFTSATLDTALFPKWGEHSVYWVKSGPRRGSFVYPDALPGSASAISASKYTGYDWRADEHYAIAFKAYAKTVAIFKSDVKSNGVSASWEAVYFKNLVESSLLGGISYYIGEKEIDSVGLLWTTQLLIMPSFAVNGSDWRCYIDSVFSAAPKLKDNLLAFLARGGTIYTEGNAVYAAEKLGLLSAGAVQYDQALRPDPLSNLIAVDLVDSDMPLSFARGAAGTAMYAGSIPRVDAGAAQVIARVSGTEVPVVFALTGTAAGNGRLLCNTALPTVGGSNGLLAGKKTENGRQLQWALNAVMYAFATNVDVTRSICNEIPDSLTAGKNAASFDRRDTLEVRVKVRNLSAQDVSGIRITEGIRDFFRFVDVLTPGVTSSFASSTLTLSGISVPAHGEKIIVYRIATPDPADAVHEKVNSYLSWGSYIYASYCTVTYTDAEGAASYRKYRNYVDLLFSARIVADADLNWKNFLGLYYQPFKVFMIMENKERTTATETRYVQYVPKDVPFYWTDNTLNIPILKTPGGKYVDVLRGSSDDRNPEFDMDSDGHPDAWLDTASIFPKNYTLEETSVYWVNPWEHLRSGNARLYEDIDHDGLRAQDTDGDGVVDVEEPGDKIRVWKITWNIGSVPGYQFYDPYCSYEVWVDPPDLVPMAAGIGSAFGKLTGDVAGMFYPYAPDVHAPNLADTSWMHWMERGADGSVLWKQLIWQKVNNYEGFTFIDTAKSHYALKPTDVCAGTVPQPHREFIAVLSLGGEEIDMNNPTPEKSLYSNLDYTTIFKERRNTPIRTTYTYYAPLPNPLQFEYLTNNFTITDPATAKPLQTLPAYGKANLKFEMDASTEYTYYWIRNAGHDVEFNDPSLAKEGDEKLGDGVFGYLMYDIPKGMGGCKITLPKRPDGSYDIDKIVKVDGHAYAPWLRNPNTRDSIQILEDPFTYRVHIPQLLIPPALDDDNGDGIDDWIDDRGDRFCSGSGFLHDGFMTGNGEAYLEYPKTPFKDDIYGWVTKGWYGGADGAYGDDFFENVGKTHFTINAQYEGLGREGPVDISKGGWLVVEEIFGGSPWVITSHAMSALAQGVNYSLTSKVVPIMARYGLDTVYLKHTIEDVGEPHAFDVRFDPYHVSYGYGNSTITTYAGGKDPCNLVSPAASFSAIIDPKRNHVDLTLIPQADTSNPDLKCYPKTVSGSFLEVRIEVSNGTDWNWVDTKVTPVLPPELGATQLVMNYVAYPRPLVPAQADPVTGAVIRKGDDIGAFRAGWRFNQPEGEVLVKMGNTLNMMMPSRRAYFSFLFSVDEMLPKGVYTINFTIEGQMRKYDGTLKQQVNYEVPSAMFSISTRDAKGNVAEYRKLVLGQGDLTAIRTDMVAPALRGLGQARWSARDIGPTDYDTLRATLPVTYSPSTGVETVDLSQFTDWPPASATRLYVLEPAQVSSYTSTEKIDITKKESLLYTVAPVGARSATQAALSLSTIGPKVILYKSVVDVNGRALPAGVVHQFAPGEAKDVRVRFQASNQGASIAENVLLTVAPGLFFAPIEGALPVNARMLESGVELSFGSLLPGETRQMDLHFDGELAGCRTVYDSSMVVSRGDAVYHGAYSLSGSTVQDVFTVPDAKPLDLPAYDFQVERVTCSQLAVSRGQNVGVYAKLVNGAVAALNAGVGFYAVVNGDTALIEEQVLPVVDKHSSTVLSARYTVPECATTLVFFAKADPRGRFGEFCEANNDASTIVGFKGLHWILDVTSFPNPLQNEGSISYTLPRRIRDMKFVLYNLEGRELLVREHIAGDIGRHSITWSDPEAPAGVYLYRFEGFEETGEFQTTTGRVMKVGK
ncbi:MAG: hypothetical protein IPP94_01535 [Ignavibacteria bacterium]|nr:hypothetical protein [Ignavibacteria bacterium]